MADYIVHKAIELDALSARAKAHLETSQDWIMSPKYDGCQVVFFFKDGQHVMTMSRTGEAVVSMPHIAAKLTALYSHHLRHGQIAIAGEAWTHGKDFNELSGMFRRQYPVHDLGFVPFDLVAWEYRTDTFSGPNVELFSIAPYSVRVAALSHRQDGVGNGYVYAPKTTQLRGPLSYVMGLAESEAKWYKASTIGAYDGVIIARAMGSYIQGAGKGGEFIKCKPLISFTVTVTGEELAAGAKTGKNTAALLFELDGKTQKVSTGLTQEQVEDIHSIRREGSQQGWRGKRIEVEAMGKTVNGFLREPRFKGIRIDA